MKNWVFTLQVLASGLVLFCASCGGSSGGGGIDGGGDPLPPVFPPVLSCSDVAGQWFVLAVVSEPDFCTTAVGDSTTFDWTVSQNGTALTVDMIPAEPDPDDVLVRFTGTLSDDCSFVLDRENPGEAGITQFMGSLSVDGSGDGRILTIDANVVANDPGGPCPSTTGSFQMFGALNDSVPIENADLTGEWELQHTVASFGNSCPQGALGPGSLSLSLNHDTSPGANDSLAPGGFTSTGAPVFLQSFGPFAVIVVLPAAGSESFFLQVVKSADRFIGVSRTQIQSCGGDSGFLIAQANKIETTSLIADNTAQVQFVNDSESVQRLLTSNSVENTAYAVDLAPGAWIFAEVGTVGTVLGIVSKELLDEGIPMRMQPVGFSPEIVTTVYASNWGPSQ